MRKSLVSLVALGLFLGAPAIAGTAMAESNKATSTQSSTQSTQSTQQQSSSLESDRFKDILADYEARSEIKAHIIRAITPEGVHVLALVGPRDLEANASPKAQDSEVRDRFEEGRFSDVVVLGEPHIYRADLDEDHYIFALTADEMLRYGVQTGSLSGDTGTQSGTESSSQSGSTTMGQTDTQSGTSDTQSGATTMSETDTQYGTSGTQSGTQMGQTDTETDTDSQTGSSQSGSSTMSQTDTQSGTSGSTAMGETESQTGTQSGTSGSTAMGETETQTGTQSGTSGSTTLGQTDTQTGTQSGTQMGQADTETGTQSGTTTMSQADTQTGTSGAQSGSSMSQTDIGQAARALSEPDAETIVSGLEEAGLDDAEEFQGRLVRAMSDGSPVFFIITSKNMDSDAAVGISEEELRSKLQGSNLEDIEFIDNAKIVRGNYDEDQVFVLAGDLFGESQQQ